MHVHAHLRKCLQDRFPQGTVDLHGVKRIMLVAPARFHFKSLILFRIPFRHISDNILLELIKACICQTDHRTDAYDPEHPAQGIRRILLVIFPFAVHIDSAVGLADREGPVHIL